MNSLYKDLDIGGVKIKGNLFLAPAAGYTDKPYRELTASMGSSFNFTEMVSCEALIRDNERTKLIMAKADNEEKYGIQLFTGNADSARKAIIGVKPFKPDLININCGCPVTKILKSGAGSDLMKTPEKIGEIVKAIKEETDIPVTVKIRSGFTQETKNFVEFAQIAVDAGAAMVGIHGRTRSQGYSGTANWDDIKKLKESIDVPVLGSGDIFTPEDAKNMLEHTGCDGVLFARGSFGNPWIFNRTKEFLLTGILPDPPSPQEKLEVAFRHLNLNKEFYPERVAFKEIKKHFCAYIKGIPGAKETRDKLMKCITYSDFKEVFDSLLSN